MPVETAQETPLGDAELISLSGSFLEAFDNENSELESLVRDLGSRNVELQETKVFQRRFLVHKLALPMCVLFLLIVAAVTVHSFAANNHASKGNPAVIVLMRKGD
ncbi:expressed unknown protein [Seminavis robusta]|uniref:Uncharacterized protein n=1 Tax=Seminavis robusta TaxID=568900 RepID=A0A9N8HZ33_9STRA|nr:expressed unknown protein [Seminavis robusta]|eukprot:Sro2159_g316980.1 n/a (105) ;mRNA; r:187-501